jgi:hypothetical protein
MIKCGSTDPNSPCDPSMDCYINHPKYFNCICVYNHYINETEHTLQEVAKLMDMSHTTVKQIQEQAFSKIKNLIDAGELTKEQVQLVLRKANLK